MVIPKFTTQAQSFHADLKKRINEYFSAHQLSPTGNYKLYFKAGILFTAFLALYVHLVFFTPPVIWAISECVIIGVIMAAIGFNVMHDGAHGSFSKSRVLNFIASHTWDFMGGSTFLWKMKHNIIHHSFTNVDGIDEDIDLWPWLRMSETQKKFKLHKFQHVYFWLIYPMGYLFMILVQDYIKYFSGKIGDMPIKKMKFADHIDFWSFKILYLIIFMVIPIYVVGFKYFIIGYVISTFIMGFILSVVFHLAHTVEHTAFPMPNAATNKFEDEWAVHQIKTTANFATHNKLISWYVGGLNFQVEHHLFPKISHVHYPAISKIVRDACRDYGLNYIEFPKMRIAVSSHVSFLKQMGRA